jgi:DNA helicase II / ATP-dependent DNA helicase PcrA
VANEEQRRRLVRESALSHHLSPGSLERHITRWKQALMYPPDLAARSAPQQLSLLAAHGENGSGPDPDADPRYLAGFFAYEAALSRENLWDYEDLIARPALLLGRRPEIRETYRSRFRQVLVDEYQDLNEAQYRLFRELVGPETEIMVIGDPDQAIYGFRGARPEYFDRFQADWPNAKVCRFLETYRLPAPILQAASALRGVTGKAEPDMVTRQTGEQPLVLLEAGTPTGEARVIAREIEALVGGLSHYGLEDTQVRHQCSGDKASFRDIAVLYRVHTLGVELARVLTSAGIPCQVAREGVGPDWDGFDLAAERVKLLTLHAAKGLEFPYVFIAGCETGLIPWEPAGQPAADLEEEKRLLYVGLTRASQQVFLTRARERTLWGQKRRTQFSPWVQAMPGELLRRQALNAPRGRSQRQPHLFPDLVLPGKNKSK